MGESEEQKKKKNGKDLGEKDKQKSASHPQAVTINKGRSLTGEQTKSTTSGAISEPVSKKPVKQEAFAPKEEPAAAATAAAAASQRPQAVSIDKTRSLTGEQSKSTTSVAISEPVAKKPVKHEAFVPKEEPPAAAASHPQAVSINKFRSLTGEQTKSTTSVAISEPVAKKAEKLAPLAKVNDRGVSMTGGKPNSDDKSGETSVDKVDDKSKERKKTCKNDEGKGKANQ